MGIFYYISFIVVVGMYFGIFCEDMFKEVENLDDFYFLIKYEFECLVWEICMIFYCIYCFGMVVGYLKMGEIDKIDGFYYFFFLLKKLC